MAGLTLSVEFVVPRRTAQGLLCALLVGLCAPELASEGVNLTTYYPSPSGIYSQMISTGNTFLARDGGLVSVGTTANASITGQASFNPGYQVWGAEATGSGGAAIVNDNNSYKKLMIVGNNSAGGNRQVGFWDDVTVSNNLTVTANETVSGSLTVSNYASVTQYLDVAGNGGSATGIGVFSQPASGNCSSAPVSYGTNNCADPFTGTANAAFCCPSGTYITQLSGVLTKYQVVNDPKNTTGQVLCCSCPTGGCPSF